jgi:hypothetical protein
MSVFCQTLYLLPLRNSNHIQDSIVEIKVYEKRDSVWKENSTWRNVYTFDEDGALKKAKVLGQNYSIKYEKSYIKCVSIYNEKKIQMDLFYSYNEKYQVFKIAIYNYINNSKHFWGNEYIEYDSLNKITSSSYIIENNLSMHPGYSHSASYEYDSMGRLIIEDWGYEKKTHFYDNDGKIEYTIIQDNEFGANREYKNYYQIYVQNTNNN